MTAPFQCPFPCTPRPGNREWLSERTPGKRQATILDFSSQPSFTVMVKTSALNMNHIEQRSLLLLNWSCYAPVKKIITIS
jgi:hypothetical protein